jgi:hypothetical protein
LADWVAVCASLSDLPGVVFSKLYNPKLLYVPDTHVALQSWDATVTASIDVWAMGCGWTAEPYQTHPTVETISKYA